MFDGSPLHEIPIFIGTEEKTEIAASVLEFSLRRHTEHKLKITRMVGPEWEYPLDGIKVGTGFSLRRWMIPAACGWKGHAIYLDADQIVFGDINELFEYRHQDVPKGTSAWCTYQPNRYTAGEDWAHTSVMVIDCEAAKEQWGWYLDKILAYLRKDPSKMTYGRFMAGQWMIPQPAVLPNHWNHLNKFNSATKLLHYTKEPEQPWYVPEHPLAKIWMQELIKAIASGYVSKEAIEKALAAWNRKEDWRSTNGLHPYYKCTLSMFEGQSTSARLELRPSKLFLESKNRPDSVLMATTFAKDMYEVSGKQLLQSFLDHNVEAKLLVCSEGIDIETMPKSDRISYFDITNYPLLTDFLEQNKAVIPTTLGGTRDSRCTCPRGPFPSKSTKHRPKCPAFWFIKNFSRWFRKVVSQKVGLDFANAHDYTHMFWVDSDCVFQKDISVPEMTSWFKDASLLYFKHKRDFIETGLIGYNLKECAASIIQEVLYTYTSGDFQKLARWDDCYAYQKVINRFFGKALDAATMTGPNADVINCSPIGKFIKHAKGSHSNEHGVMT